MAFFIIFDRNAKIPIEQFKSDDIALYIPDFPSLNNRETIESLPLQSLSIYIDQNKTRVRAKTLSLLSSISKLSANSVPIINKLSIDEHTSLFWASPLGEKCNILKAPWINELIALAAVYNMARDYSVKQIYTYGATSAQAAQLDELFKCQPIDLIHTSSSLRMDPRTRNFCLTIAFYSRLLLQLTLRPISAFFWLLRVSLLHSRLPRTLVQSGSRKDLPLSTDTLILVDYYCYLRPTTQSIDSVAPIYWGSLLETKLNPRLDLHLWHHHIPGLSPDPVSCAKLIKILSKSLTQNPSHLFIESSLSFRLLLRVLGDWSKSLATVVPIARVLFNSRHLAARLALPDYVKWHTGAGSLKLILYYYMYKHAFAKLHALSPSSKIIFLQENLDLEYVLLSSIRQHSNAEVIGYPHSIVRFWDLRFFHLQSECVRTMQNQFPRYLPDTILLNGQCNRQELASHYGDTVSFLDVEATRYESLNLTHSHALSNSSPNHKQFAILLLSGIESRATKIMFDAAVASVRILSKKYPNTLFQLGLKLHPQINMTENLDGLDFPVTIEHEPILELMSKYNLAVVDSNTSAIVDTLSVGMASINFVGNRTVDLSPSSSLPHVQSVYSTYSLANHMERVYLHPSKQNIPDIFYFSRSNERWIKLLSMT